MNPFRNTDLALLLIRLTFGGLMAINHGWGKFMKFFAEGPIKFPDPLGVGEALSLALTVFAEFFCALFVVIGLFTRQAVLPLIITMLVAIFVMHWGDSFAKKELAILYLIPYIILFFMGSGAWSVDGQIRKIQ